MTTEQADEMLDNEGEDMNITSEEDGETSEDYAEGSFDDYDEEGEYDEDGAIDFGGEE